jgi:lysyl-tRNA synthetase class 2
MSPLAKSFACPRTGQAVAARTELFMAGRELANMYEEENDPAAQRRKFVEQLAAKTTTPTTTEQEGEGESAAVVVDESYVHALASGLPPTGGWGCGVERLVMMFAGTRRIGDCLSFGNLRNVVGLSAAGPGSAAASAAGAVASAGKGVLQLGKEQEQGKEEKDGDSSSSAGVQ